MKTFPYLLAAVLTLWLCPDVGAIEPQPPRTLLLDPETIHPLPLSPTIDLLLSFPEEVAQITGQGLTTGETPGQVQFQQGQDNRKLVTLRLLDSKASPLIQIVLQSGIFVFRLQASDTPATVLSFKLDPKHDPARAKAREITHEEAQKKKAPPSGKRLKQMVNLVGQEPKLREKIPEAYTGYNSITSDLVTHTKDKFVKYEVSRIGRFAHDDTLIFFGKLTNKRKTAVSPSDLQLDLEVAAKRFPKLQLYQSQKSAPPGESLFLWGVLVGDGKGKPLHLSLSNHFSLHLLQ